MKTQVLIIGAGPVGLTMAAELARYGVAVRIIEKAAERTDKSKALVLWSRTLELLERAGCSQTFVQGGLQAHGANIIADGKLVGHVSLDGIGTPYPYALMIPQSETERLLEEHLNRLGVTVERRVELKSFADDGKVVTSVIAHADGTGETVESAWLVGCDGAHSTVRHGLGLAFEGNTLTTDFILADVHVAGFVAADTEISTFWHQDGVLVFFPIAPGRSRIIADLGPSTGPTRPTPTLEECQAIVDRRGPGGIVLSNPIWLAGFGINERKVKDYSTGRVFLAGDAAHIHSPAGGQGMNTGMQDAFNLAWKLAMACHGGSASTDLLDSYSIERSAVGDKVLADAGRLTKAAMIRNWPLQLLRNAVAHHVLGYSAVQHAMTENLSELNIAYPGSPLTGSSARRLKGPTPGNRMAPRAGEIPVGSGDRPLFAVLATASVGLASVLARHAGTVEATPRTPDDPAIIVLVRPDGYVAMTSAAEDWQDIDAYLDRISAGDAVSA